MKKKIMKHIKLYENFKEGPMKKPQGFFSRTVQGAKHALGFENEEDRKSLESLKRALAADPKYGYATNIKELKPGVIVGWVTGSSVTVDINTPEILYKGKELDLHNLPEEADFVYHLLLALSDDKKTMIKSMLKNGYSLAPDTAY